MTEQLIQLDTARLAKEKGFDIRCDYFYNDGSGWKLQNDSLIRTGEDEFLEAPTQSLLQKWLRDVHDTVIVIRRTGGDNYWHWYIQGVIEDGYADTYEQALEEGLLCSLKLL
jgi:hypothetical protein